MEKPDVVSFLRTGQCPVNHQYGSAAEGSASSSQASVSPASAASGSGCPVSPEQQQQYLDHDSTRMLNPLNQIPNLTQQPHPSQKVALSTDRETSSIPRADVKENWMYPSPQMFYNALQRKGMASDEEQMDMVVAIHNFLNESCWDEIKRWESMHDESSRICGGPRLARFRGRPNDLSPRAWFWSLFGSPRPFDRHDWTVDRCGKQVRYVIDYYHDESSPKEEGAVFYADVRPALDSFGAVYDRIRMSMSSWW